MSVFEKPIWAVSAGSLADAVLALQHGPGADPGCRSERPHRASRDRGDGTEAHTGAAPSQGACNHRAAPRNADCGRADANTGDRRREREIRHGSPKHRSSGRRNLASGQPSGHRSAAAGKQRLAGQGAVAVSRRNPGFGRKRRSAYTQRARQSAVPHQRHHAARRRRRLRANPRHRHRRQHGAADRRAAGAIWPAHRGRAGHPDQGGCLQQLRQCQRLWRQSRHDQYVSRIWRHRRTDPILRVRALFRKQSGNRKSSAGE